MAQVAGYRTLIVVVVVVNEVLDGELFPSRLLYLEWPN